MSFSRKLKKCRKLFCVIDCDFSIMIIIRTKLNKSLELKESILVSLDIRLGLDLGIMNFCRDKNYK